MKMGDMIPFPKPKVKLTAEEYEKFEEYKKKMQDARTMAECNFYYSKAKNLIEKTNERKNK